MFFFFFCCSLHGAKEHLLSRDDGPSTGLTQTPVPENIELRSRTFFPPKPGERRFSFQTLDWRELLQLAASLFTFLYLHYIYIFFTKDREVVVCIKGIFFEMALFYMLLLFMMCVVSEWGDYCSGDDGVHWHFFKFLNVSFYIFICRFKIKVRSFLHSDLWLLQTSQIVISLNE